MVLDTIANAITSSFGIVWDVFTELAIAILIIVYLAIFFGVQYFLIKGYIWLAKTVYSIPIIKNMFNTLFKDLFGTNPKT